MANNNPQNRIMRPPVVVVMGHIDHGKSTLLDFIRKTHIVDSEAGGITQHVGAYQAEHISADGIKHPITFLDTPGHEAFCSIRERGAQAADVAILVVSAEDGVKPQTIEAYKNIKAQNIPFIVAINKIDKPNADINKTKQSLGEHEIYLESWGGDVPNVAISALKGTGVSELLDMVILIAELADLKSDANRPAEGIVIESELNNRKGISATLLVKDGILKTGMFVVADNAYAPVRFIENFRGEKIPEATAAMPAIILGWTEIPACGSIFVTVNSKKEAERIIGDFKSKEYHKKNDAQKALDAEQKLAKASSPTGVAGSDTDPKEAKLDPGQIVSLPLIIKADVIGSLEGIKYELKKLKSDKVQIKIVTEAIGEINENDIKTALSDPEIIVIGFNAKPDKKATSLIERSPVNVKLFNIIYELSQFVKETLDSKIPKEYMEETTGSARILAVFSKEKDRQVIGGKVESGTISAGNDVRIMRRNAEIGRGKIRELQEKKAKTREVAEGHEFGVMVEAKVEIAVSDKIEAVRTVEKIGRN